MKSKRVALHSLGCKVNSYETEIMQQRLQEKGYEIVPFEAEADIYIINTCTVTNMADRKSRQMLHRARQLNPNALVVAAGCYVQTGREAVEKDHSVDLLIGNNRKRDIVEILEEYLKGREKPAEKAAGAGEKLQEEGTAETGTPDKTLRGSTVPDIAHTYEYEEAQLRQTAEHTRAYIKIQDGCNQFCSYCAIPYARGRARSRREEDILQEIRGLAQAGYREVVLTGIHISSYGIEGLIGLMERIQEVEGVDRIRLGSLEPRIISPDTAKRLARLPKLCPHFHLSLQSGCDETLRRMNRHYTTGEYYASVENLRREFEAPAITTDVIVGFPGETEEEFAATRAFLEKVRFYEMHVFKYSRREGTAAAAMPGQIPEPVKTARSSELLELEKRQSAEFRKKYIGREAQVLLEETREIDGTMYAIGHTKDYVRVAVRVKDGEKKTSNRMAKVRVSGFLSEEILM
ncbi:MAG: tRNA (N(6)-L-threonylcarbamoyladenosine(37)-C(2))-methylthiotransferase MtaB [Acetatifactor sp.]|nr:tRNA (N(6)-L-threonylcarbamoyladenosine(37)-C(2))-methylthiotransferase MtaB [Acetatifactor sp.]